MVLQQLRIVLPAYHDAGLAVPRQQHAQAARVEVDPLLAHAPHLNQAWHKLDDQQRKAAAQLYGAAAMRLLRDAVRKGSTDVRQMKKATALDPLRLRDDFRGGRAR
jgi:hypothetical protein